MHLFSRGIEEQRGRAVSIEMFKKVVLIVQGGRKRREERDAFKEDLVERDTAVPEKCSIDD